jgi:hypothetical protein
VGDSDQDSSSITGIDVCSGRTPVFEPLERAERTAHDLVRRWRAETRDEGDAAGVVLEPRVVQTLGLGLHASLPPLV